MQPLKNRKRPKRDGLHSQHLTVQESGPVSDIHRHLSTNIHYHFADDRPSKIFNHVRSARCARNRKPNSGRTQALTQPLAFKKGTRSSRLVT